MNTDLQKTAVIIASRPVTAGMHRYLPENPVVITADAGWKTAVAMGLTIDMAVGDFDSSPPPGDGEIQNGVVRQLVHLPAEKDDTDTFYAAQKAIQMGCTHAVLLGGLGGRLDHTQANFQVLLHLAKNNMHAFAAEQGMEVHCLAPGRLEIPVAGWKWLSVFAAGGPAGGVTLQGVRYPLTDATLLPDVPLGTSNEFAAAKAVIQCASGYLYIMVCE